MASTFTTNKGIEKPASGDYVNAWASPVNADWDDIDTALGGTTTLSTTDISGPVPLTLVQYRPLNIEFTGSLTAAINYQIPTGVGGIWSLNDLTARSGSPTIFFSILSGNSIIIPPGRSLVVSDGVNVSFAASPVITGTFTGNLTGGAGGGSSNPVNCAYTVIGRIVTIWKSDDALITVTSGAGQTLVMTGIPPSLEPSNSAGQNAGYVTGYIGGSFYEIASSVTGNFAQFATLDISSGMLQRNSFGFVAGTVCGFKNFTLTYPLDD